MGEEKTIPAKAETEFESLHPVEARVLELIDEKLKRFEKSIAMLNPSRRPELLVPTERMMQYLEEAGADEGSNPPSSAYFNEDDYKSVSPCQFPTDGPETTYLKVPLSETGNLTRREMKLYRPGPLDIGYFYLLCAGFSVYYERLHNPEMPTGQAGQWFFSNPGKFIFLLASLERDPCKTIHTTKSDSRFLEKGMNKEFWESRLNQWRLQADEFFANLQMETEGHQSFDANAHFARLIARSFWTKLKAQVNDVDLAFQQRPRADFERRLAAEPDKSNHGPLLVELDSALLEWMPTLVLNLQDREPRNSWDRDGWHTVYEYTDWRSIAKEKAQIAELRVRKRRKKSCKDCEGFQEFGRYRPEELALLDELYESLLELKKGWDDFLRRLDDGITIKELVGYYAFRTFDLEVITLLDGFYSGLFRELSHRQSAEIHSPSSPQSDQGTGIVQSKGKLTELEDKDLVTPVEAKRIMMEMLTGFKTGEDGSISDEAAREMVEECWKHREKGDHRLCLGQGWYDWFRKDGRHYSRSVGIEPRSLRHFQKQAESILGFQVSYSTLQKRECKW